jgi:hypothetical protein
MYLVGWFDDVVIKVCLLCCSVLFCPSFLFFAPLRIHSFFANPEHGTARTHDPTRVATVRNFQTFARKEYEKCAHFELFYLVTLVTQTPTPSIIGVNKTIKRYRYQPVSLYSFKQFPLPASV